MKKYLALLAMAASLLAVSCHKNNVDDEDDPTQEESKGLGIKIDGSFDDWGALKPDVVVSAKNNPNSPWDAVNEIRCCADEIRSNKSPANVSFNFLADGTLKVAADCGVFSGA